MKDMDNSPKDLKTRIDRAALKQEVSYNNMEFYIKIPNCKFKNLESSSLG